MTAEAGVSSLTDFLPLYLALFLAMIGFGLTLPVLPSFVERLAIGPAATDAGVALHVGALTSAYAFSQIVFGPLWGWWSDRHGRRPVIALGLVGVAASHVTFGLGTSLPLLYGARLLGGLFAAAVVVASTAAIVDRLPVGSRGRAMAWQGTAISLGFVAGPALGGLFAREAWHLPLTGQPLVFDGFSIPFFLAAAMSLAALPSILRAPAPPRSESRGGSRVTHIAWRSMIGRMRDVFGLMIVAQGVLALFEAVFALYATRVLRFGLNEIGLAFALCGLVMAVFQGGAVAWLSGRVSIRVQVSSGFALLGGGLLLLLMLDRVVAVLGAVSLLALGVALVTPNILTLVADRSGSAAGSGLGLVNTAAGLGQVVGPLAGGVLFGLRAELPFLVAGATTLAVAITTFHTLESDPRSSGIPI